MTHEEPEFLTDICNFTTLVYVIFRHKSSESDLYMDVICNLWSLDLTIHDFGSLNKVSSVKKVSY